MYGIRSIRVVLCWIGLIIGDEVGMDSELYVSFWIYLAYCLSMVFLVLGFVKGVQVWIYYGLFFIIMGLLFNIGFKITILYNMLLGSVVEVLEEDM